MKLTKKEAQELFLNGSTEIQGLFLKIHEYGTWEDFGNFDNLEGQIYVDEITSKFYCLSGVSRYGSYRDGYNFHNCDLYEVQEQPVTVMEWVSVPQS